MSQSLSKNKVAEICAVLRKETIEPAKQEAKEIIDNAHLERKALLKTAKQEAEQLEKKTKAKLEKEKSSFTSSLRMAFDQSLDTLQQAVEKQLLRPSVSSLFEKNYEDPKLFAKLIDAVSEGLKKDGINADLQVFIAKNIPKEKLLSALKTTIKKQLIEAKVEELSLGEGIEIRLKGEGITIDLTRKSLEEMLTKFLRKDFKEMIFQDTAT